MIRDDITETPFADLLDEVQSKNHVRVQVFRSTRGHSGVRVMKRVLDEMAEDVKAYGPALYLADSVRALKGLKPIYVPEYLRRLGGELVGVITNTRTNVGIDYCANALGSTTQPSQADWIALSNNTLGITTADTAATIPWSTAQAVDVAAGAATGEWTALGLARKQATYAHTTSAASYSMAATWTATGTVTATSKAGLFGGSTKNTAQSSATTNILFLANTFTATTLATNDQLSLTWTVNI